MTPSISWSRKYFQKHDQQYQCKKSVHTYGYKKEADTKHYNNKQIININQHLNHYGKGLVI